MTTGKSAELSQRCGVIGFSYLGSTRLISFLASPSPFSFSFSLSVSLIVFSFLPSFLPSFIPSFLPSFLPSLLLSSTACCTTLRRMRVFLFPDECRRRCLTLNPRCDNSARLPGTCLSTFASHCRCAHGDGCDCYASAFVFSSTSYLIRGRGGLIV